MPRSFTRLIVIPLGAFAALLVLLALASVYLTKHVRPQVAAAAADSLGYEVRIGGTVHIGLFPTPHVAVRDVHLRNAGNEFAVIDEVDLGMGLMSAYRQEARIDRIALKGVRIELVRNSDGRLNIERSRLGAGPLPDVVIANLTASKVTLSYRDAGSGNGFEVSDCGIGLNRIRLLPGNRAEWIRSLSFAAIVSCAGIRLKELVAADVRATIVESNGVLDIDPFTLRLFDGHGAGDVRIDFSRLVPRYQARYQLKTFRSEEFFKTLTAKTLGTGPMDFSTALSAQGASLDELTRSAEGTASLRGSELTLAYGDLDRKFSEFATTQNFTLVDAGAFFFAGPIGLGITKGYDFERILKDKDGSTPVQTLVSDWRIGQGVAHATDVAMATQRNRVALKGGLDFGTDQFVDVTVALVDEHGCSTAEQKLRGSFLKPEIAAPNVLKAMEVPTRRLLGKATGLLGHRCIPFYTGTVASPIVKNPAPVNPRP